MIEKLAKRKQIELQAKLEIIENELTTWYERSEAKGPMEKHHTQVRALQAHLKGWHTSIQNKLTEYEKRDADGYLSNCGNAENLILSEHRIWEYFRSKFLQRQEAGLVDYLRAADEFAWECYHPVQAVVFPQAKDPKRKEPPLTFFNGGLSPFSVSRGKTFRPEAVAGKVLNLNPEDYLLKLPIPVVGVPWDQVSHLPAVLVLGHEVGHIVEDDFGLTGDLQRILKDAITAAKAETREAAWTSWLGEIFADLYGCLAAGPAFAGTLIDFLAKGKSRISGEERIHPKWDSYPTDYLRVCILFKALEVMNFEAELADYKKLWEEYSSKMPKEYSKDIDKIVPGLLESKQDVLGSKSIKDVFCFSADQQQAVNTTLTAIKKIKPDTTVAIPTTDIRVLFAALRRAYEFDPGAYVANGCGTAALEHIEQNVIKAGVRAGRRSLKGRALKNKLQSYEQAGSELIDGIFAGLSEPPATANEPGKE
jgi:hypothetical protein